MNGKDLQKLDAIVSYIVKHYESAISAPLKEAMAAVEASNGAEGWLKIVSDKTEEAIEIESREDWDNSEEGVSEEVENEAQEEIEESNDEPELSKEVFYIPEDIEIALVGEFITECSELIEMAEGAKTK